MSRVQLAVLGKRVASASLTTIQSQRRKKKKKRSHTGLASLYTQGREHVSSLRGSGVSRRTDHRERAASTLQATVTGKTSRMEFIKASSQSVTITDGKLNPGCIRMFCNYCI